MKSWGAFAIHHAHKRKSHDAHRSEEATTISARMREAMAGDAPCAKSTCDVDETANFRTGAEGIGVETVTEAKKRGKAKPPGSFSEPHPDVIAWYEWKRSPDGQRCLEGSPSDQNGFPSEVALPHA